MNADGVNAPTSDVEWTNRVGSYNQPHYSPPAAPWYILQIHSLHKIRKPKQTVDIITTFKERSDFANATVSTTRRAVQDDKRITPTTSSSTATTATMTIGNINGTVRKQTTSTSKSTSITIMHYGVDDECIFDYDTLTTLTRSSFVGNI